jgi:16S rRNA (adenine1518-N6/adenine1519-N6)-dimethyltransferase
MRIYVFNLGKSSNRHPHAALEVEIPPAFDSIIELRYMVPGPVLHAGSRKSKTNGGFVTSPRTLLNAWKIKAKKAFGQNFLSEPSTGEMIASRCDLSPSDVVLEIGAGLGGLTVPLARRAGRVIALEKDRDLIRLLETELKLYGIANVELLQGDILRLDLLRLTEGMAKIIVAGNLPYNISSQIVVKMIHTRHRIDRAVIMLQREMAQRLKAAPGSRDYGRLAVMLQYCAAVRSLAVVRADMFFPRPKIDSEVLEIRFFETPPDAVPNENFLFQVVKAAFGKRRKTLKNALSSSELNLCAAEAEKALTEAGIEPVRRAETLSVAEFVALSRQLGTPEDRPAK